MLRLLLKEDEYCVNDEDCHGRTLLSYALENGHETIVRLLLAQRGIAGGNSSLSMAIQNGHIGIVHLLLAQYLASKHPAADALKLIKVHLNARVLEQTAIQQIRQSLSESIRDLENEIKTLKAEARKRDKLGAAVGECKESTCVKKSIDTSLKVPGDFEISPW